MRLRAGVLSMTAALLLLGAPAGAQDEFTGVSFGGVAFAFGPELGESVNISRVPARPTGERQPFGAEVTHITFTLYGPGQEGGRTPRVGLTEGTVRAYRVDDLEADEAASPEIDALRDLFGDRPDLDAYMTLSGEDVERMPRLPADLGAAEALRARAAYIDSPELTGIASIVGYRQDVYPFAAGEFFYSFQAISTDGQWYVTGDFIVEASMFPQRVRPQEARGVARRWDSYLAESTQTLNAATPTAFEPPLTAIENLIESFTFVPAEG